MHDGYGGHEHATVHVWTSAYNFVKLERFFSDRDCGNTQQVVTSIHQVNLPDKELSDEEYHLEKTVRSLTVNDWLSLQFFHMHMFFS